MAINFGGLASGLDTAAIIDALMDVERQPIVRLEADKEFFTNRLSAFKEFNSRLTSFLSSVEALNSSSDLQPKNASLSKEDFFSATAATSAANGTYQLKAVSLAQVQKDVSFSGYANKTSSVFHNGTIIIDDGQANQTTIALDADESLESIAEKINDETSSTGVTASIINDGTANGYRLVLSSGDAETSFSVEVAGITVDSPNAALDFGHSFALSTNKHSGSYASQNANNFETGTITVTNTADDSIVGIYTISNDDLNGIASGLDAIDGIDAVVTGNATDGYKLEVSSTDPNTLKEFSISVSGGTTSNGYAALEFGDPNSHTQDAALASIVIDGVTIISPTNTFTDAIEGVALTIDDADAGATTTNLTVSLDEATLNGKMQAFVSGYNNVMSFITEQSALGDDAVGLLSGDSTLSMVKRRLQSLLTTRIAGNESISTLSGLGLETQKDGSLTLDNATLSDAIKNNLDDVVKLLAGEGSGAPAVDGINSRFQEFLEDITSTTDGFLTARQKSYDNNIRRMVNDISRLELRLAKREETLNRQFMALETLVSTLNSQSDFLTQQIDLMKNIWSKK
jgi:flagellar hook-associated protein 2